MEPLTVDEVAELWRQSDKLGPHPTAVAFAQLTDQLNAHLGFADSLRLRAEHDRRAAEAARLLINVTSNYLKLFEKVDRVELPELHQLLSGDDYDILLESLATLVELLSVYDPLNFRRLAPEWAVWFAGRPGEQERLARLRRQLERVDIAARVGARRRTRQPPIWEDCGIICWMIARDALRALDREAGHTADSIAVKFAASATQRLGFPRVTARALALRLARRGLK
jgi:hypothetical protein